MCHYKLQTAQVLYMYPHFIISVVFMDVLDALVIFEAAPATLSRHHCMHTIREAQDPVGHHSDHHHEHH